MLHQPDRLVGATVQDLGVAEMDGRQVTRIDVHLAEKTAGITRKNDESILHPGHAFVPVGILPKFILPFHFYVWIKQ
ncbi:MAG: hypothetical protein C7N36_15140 [Bacteroidetes bacterium]|nr:MAG: hypothetical protein C7N36_15140 [Bacteroidota bacterium]